jgi:8-oxo-dGTP pyrophosphatase MutT (NUDIX family)
LSRKADECRALAAGHIESGADSAETAVRELAEELGVECSRAELDFAFTVPAEQAWMGGCNCFEDVYFLERSSDVATAIGQGPTRSLQSST